MGKEDDQSCGGGTKKPSRSGRESAGVVPGKKKFLRCRSVGCRWKIAASCRRRAEVEIQWPNFSRGRKRWKRCVDRCRSERTQREISGEQVNPADRIDSRWKGRRTCGERARCWQGREQGRGSA